MPRFQTIAWILIATAVLWLAWESSNPTPTSRPVPPSRQPQPQPQPQPRPCPDDSCRPRRPWGDDSSASVEASVSGPEHPDGTRIRCELPGNFHQRNTGGSDGAGLCVFASMRHTGLWQNESAFSGLFNYMRNFPGGGYPSKVDAMLKRYCQEKNLPMPQYLQVEGSDLEILKAACRSGRMPCVTYGVSPTGRYGGRRIAHMVSLVHADDRHFVILDNNFPGEQAYEWLTPQEFLQAYTAGGGGWAIILVDPPGAPPRPWNAPL